MYTPLTPHLKSIGVYDTDIDLFESQYPVPKGITYNSYLLEGDNATAVLDAVDANFAPQWLKNLEDALDGRRPDYLIMHHLEPDHSGSLARAMETYPQLRLVASAKAVAMLPQFCPEASGWTDRIVKVTEGDTIDLGGGTALTFMMAPMVHWPEVAVSFETSEGTLFSADAFGTFGPALQSEVEWTPEAARYYFNICGKYGTFTLSLLKKAGALQVKRIAPLHGPVLEGETMAAAIASYAKWSAYEPDIEGVFIPYASIYGNTGTAAAMMAEMLGQRGVPTVLVDLARCDMSEAVSLAMRHRAMLLCAASYDASVFPPMADFLHHLALKGYCNRTVGMLQNGSWAPTAARAMRAILDAMKGITTIDPVVGIKTAVAPGDINAMGKLADALAAIKNNS